MSADTQPAGGFVKLNALREYLLAAPLGLNPDHLITFIDKGKVISYPGGNNKNFKFVFPAQLIVIGYADAVDKLAFFILQWLDQYQPDHDGEAFTFDAEIIDHRQTDISITLTLTETITVSESAEGITLNHCTEPSILPVTIPGATLEVLLNDEPMADWVNGGKYESYPL
ncbi:phage tail protein [Sedimenticola hydrogenitrophicus]|uniref:phage tail protein n=1 Tax=Sedimenticola hydrogenitrophicus TaxID=2967975 RepID=UPI0023B03A04|nr:phage tail protein [Sedimenticola hydrogenitrophicus]